MDFKQQYYSVYKDLCETGRQTIYTKDINSTNINTHFESIINILKDGIDKKEVQNMVITVIFQDDIDIELSIFDYCMNLMFWQLCALVNQPIYSIHLVYFEDINRKEIKEYIDNIFVDKYRKSLEFIDLNQTIDAVIGKFRSLRPFQLYLANTLNLKDTIDLMNQYPEFADTVHFSTDGIPLEDVKDKGMEATNVQIKYIKNSDHCLRDSFRTGEAISPKQYKEVAVNIGSKPDGQGSVFPHPIKHSFINGGLQDPEEFCVESSVGRIAQILQKTNVGESGAFARNLENNNQDTFLNEDPNYICDTQNFEEVFIDNATKLNMYDLRYYRENPKGVDKLLHAKRGKSLIGRKLYFRSPMCCASAARGHGICYKCYGDLAYTNQEINIGQIAAEALSSIYTQILLSAKHLLESLVIKLKWNKEFYDIFDVTFNSIALKSEGVYRGWKMIIDEDIKSEDEMDEAAYNYYINSFIVRTNEGAEIRIHTEESDNIYLYSDLLDLIDQVRNKTDENEPVELDMVRLMDLDVLFIMEMKNNELSATMNKIKKLIDNKSVIAEYDRNSILEAFVNTNILGNIKLNAVHFEILLMNQIRALDDELELPDWWSVPDQKYQILTLSKALSNNRSIAVRLQSNKVGKALSNPQNRVIHQPAISDLYYMEKPQEYLDDDMISDDFDPDSDIEDNVIQPISFDNPKIRVGRPMNKRK